MVETTGSSMEPLLQMVDLMFQSTGERLVYYLISLMGEMMVPLKKVQMASLILLELRIFSLMEEWKILGLG